MTVITKLGSWIKKPAEPSEKELLTDFVGDLETVLQSMEELMEEVNRGYEEQVVKKRSLATKLVSIFPSFLQPRDIREQRKKVSEINQTRQKMATLRGTLAHVRESIESMDTSTGTKQKEVLGRRVYEIAYPGESLSEQKVETLEERLQILENNFLTSMEQLNAQINQISTNLQLMTKKMDEQGVKLEKIDEKIDEVNSRLKKVQEKLVSISRKLTQNRTLLALLAGSVVALLIVVVVL